MKHKMLLASAIVALLTAGVWTGYGQKERAWNASFEYQVIADPTQARALDDGINQLNQLGAQGWEIVGLAHGNVYLKRTKR
jgi:predicted negative regulator of RcsB-dependent stress response